MATRKIVDLDAISSISDDDVLLIRDTSENMDKKTTITQLNSDLGDSFVTKASYNANTVLAANDDDTPLALPVGASTIVGRKATGNISAMSKTETLTVLNVEDGADVTDATNVDSAGAVMESDYDANTILKADSDNTPATLTVAEQTLVGRITSGDIAALTATQVRTLLNVEDGADVTDSTNVNAVGAVMESDFDVNTILAATLDNIPAALTITEQTLVGRITSGDIAALSATQVRTLLNVEDGADVTDSTNVDSAGAVMESDYNANTILTATADNTPSALTVAEQTLVGRLTSGDIAALTGTQIASIPGIDFVPQNNISIYVDNSRTDTYTPDGSILKPYKTLSDCMTAIGAPADTADARKKIVVHINAGQYDEDVYIPQQRMMTLDCIGTVVLGDGADDDLYNSTTPRDLIVQNSATGEPADAPSRPMFAVKGVTTETSSTHSAYGAGNLLISGDLVFNHLDGNTTTHETCLCGVKVQGDVVANANELGSVHNIILGKCFFDNTFNLSNSNLNVCCSTEFDGLITATGFGRFLNCEISGGITGAMVNYYPPNGFYHCVVNGGTWTITNALIDHITRQTIIDNTITVTGGYILTDTIYGVDVELAKIGSPTYDNLQEFLNNRNSSAILDGSGEFITVNSAFNGTIDIAAIKGYIKISDSPTAELKAFDIAATSGMSLDNGFNHIYIDYNSGTPIFAKSASLPNHTTQLAIGCVFKDASTSILHIINGMQDFDDFQDKVLQRFHKGFGFQRVSGIITTGSSYARGLYITEGIIFHGITEDSFSLFDSGGNYIITGGGTGGTISANNTIVLDSTHGDLTDCCEFGSVIRIHSSSNGNDGAYTVYSSSWDSTNTTIIIVETSLNTGDDTGHVHDQTFTYWYYNGSAWVPTIGSIQIDNQNYNNISSGLSALTVNKYGVHWVYTGVDGHVHVIYGQGDYVISEAESATIPSALPDIVSSCCLLAAKIIIQKSSASLTEVSTAWETYFIQSLANDHNQLAGLQGGTTDEYYHLTSAQHTVALDAVTKTTFDANTILKADTDNTPSALTVAEQTLVGRITSGSIAALSATQARTLLNVEDGADVTDSTNVNAAGAVMESDYNAYTILAADTDNTPAALTVGASRLVGRKSTGGIVALTPAETLAELSSQASANFSINNKKITDLATPENAGDAVNKSYADGLAAGLDPKASCRVATTAELTATFVYNGTGNNGVGDTLTNAGSQAALSIDGIELILNDRVLVKDQTTMVAEVSSVDTVADSSGSLGGKYFLISAYAGEGALFFTDYYVWYDVDDGSSDPEVADHTGIEVNISADDTADTVATSTETALEALNTGATFDVSIASGNEMTITNVVGGAVANVAAGDSGFTIATDTPGSSKKKTNGIYKVTNVGSESTNWVLTRTLDSDNSPDGEISSGNYTFIEEGTTNAHSKWVMITTGTINCGDIADDTASDISWEIFSVPDTITAESGVQRVGDVLSLKLDGGTLSVSASGVKLATDQIMNSTNVDSSGAVMESDYNASTILAATVDNTPVALTIAASTIVGRKATGDISAMSASETKTILDIKATDVEISEIGTSTYDGLQDFINNTNSSMYVDDSDHITLNAALDGTIDIDAIKGYIKIATTTVAELKAFDIASTSGMAVDAGLNYIYIDYNSGTPIFAKSSSIPNHTTQLVIGQVFKETGTNILHILNGGQAFDDFQDKSLRRMMEVFGFQRSSGITTSASGLYERAIAITTGYIWEGLSKFTFSAFNSGDSHIITGGGTGGTISANNTIVLDSTEGDLTSHFTNGDILRIRNSSNGNDGVYTVYSSSWDSTNTTVVIIETTLNTGSDTGYVHDQTFYYWYYNGSAWVSVRGSIQIDNLQYNNITTGLATLTAGRYGVHWVYVSPEGHVNIVYGRGDYIIADANNAIPPSTLPDLISKFNLLAAKIIIQKSSTTLNSISSTWDVRYSSQLIQDHNNLGNIQGGTTDQYYHLTSAQHTVALDAVTKTTFDANTILKANSDNTPIALTVGEQTLVGRITSGDIAALSATQVRTLLNVEDGADVTDSTNVDAAGAVMESDYNANTILAATADNTPSALTIAEQTLVGRITSGNIAALSATQARTLLNIEDGADVTDSTNVDAAGAVMESDYNANTILAATADNTPSALTVTEQTLVGRITSGDIAALSATQVRTLLNVEDGADVTDTTNVNAAGAVMDTDFTAKGTLISASAESTPAFLAPSTNGLVLTLDSGEATGLKWSAPAPAAHATTHKNSGDDELLLHELGEPTSAVEFSGQQANNFVAQNVADAAALAALTPVLGKLAFQVDTLEFYVCTAV